MSGRSETSERVVTETDFKVAARLLHLLAPAERVPDALSIDMALLAKNGWEVSFVYDDSKPCTYGIFADRDDWRITYHCVEADGSTGPITLMEWVDPDGYRTSTTFERSVMREIAAYETAQLVTRWGV